MTFMPPMGLSLGERRERNHGDARLLDRGLRENLVVGSDAGRGEIDAEEIGRCGVEHGIAGFAETVGEPVARTAEPVAHRSKPGIARIEPEGDRRLQVRGCREGQELVRSGKHVGKLWRGDHPADLPPGEREDFAGGADFDRALSHSEERRDRGEAPAIEQYVLPHLVADDDEVVLSRDLGNGLEFFSVEQSSGWIVRVIQEDRARP
jgi:hypothetical protein